MNIWKIGSRWGNQGESVLEVFLYYDCVFFGGCEDSGIGDWNAVKPGDYFLISNGTVPVAIGKSTGVFTPVSDSKITFLEKDISGFFDEYVRICPASIILLPPGIEKDWSIDPQRRFCRYHAGDEMMAKDVDSLWSQINDEQRSSIDIVPRTCSLFTGASCIFSENLRYKIPKYQRSYSWGENEIRKLLETIRDAVLLKENVFLGTMQLSKPITLSLDGQQKAYEVIDGQQRITTFLLLQVLLEQLLKYPRSSYFDNALHTLVSRGEEQKKLNDFLMFVDYNHSIEEKTAARDNLYIQNFCLLKSLLQEYFDNNSDKSGNPSQEALYDFLISDKIKLVVIETYASLSKTLQIFNTINTAGLDLGSEDLFKIRFYEYLKQWGEDDSVFDEISDLYARIEATNRSHSSQYSLSMCDILRTYQRVLIAKEKLGIGFFKMSQETFFERLFDTLLGVRLWPEFKALDSNKKLLEISDIGRIIQCYIENYSMYCNDPHFCIINQMLGETRYGFVWDFPIIARFFGSIQHEQIFCFTMNLLKLLCPPSLYYAKITYSIQATLLDLLKALAEKNIDNLFDKATGEWWHDNTTPSEMLNKALDFSIAYNPKWKNLICKLVEYLSSEYKDNSLYNRLWSDVDIEHIQCYTDEEDREKIWNDWEEELNKMGNLVLLERSINRRINNHKQKKKNGYEESHFESVKKLVNHIDNWTKEDAVKRRKENGEMLFHFLIGNDEKQ